LGAFGRTDGRTDRCDWLLFFLLHFSSFLLLAFPAVCIDRFNLSSRLPFPFPPTSAYQLSLLPTLLAGGYGYHPFSLSFFLSYFHFHFNVMYPLLQPLSIYRIGILILCNPMYIAPLATVYSRDTPHWLFPPISSSCSYSVFSLLVLLSLSSMSASSSQVGMSVGSTFV